MLHCFMLYTNSCVAQTLWAPSMLSMVYYNLYHYDYHFHALISVLNINNETNLAISGVKIIDEANSWWHHGTIKISGTECFMWVLRKVSSLDIKHWFVAWLIQLKCSAWNQYSFVALPALCRSSGAPAIYFPLRIMLLQPLLPEEWLSMPGRERQMKNTSGALTRPSCGQMVSLWTWSSMTEETSPTWFIASIHTCSMVSGTES